MYVHSEFLSEILILQIQLDFASIKSLLEHLSPCPIFYLS